MAESATTTPCDDLIDRYLDTMTRMLTRIGFPEHGRIHKPPRRTDEARLWRELQEASDQDLRLVAMAGDDDEQRRTGLDWPAFAETMVGWERLTNLRWCVEQAIKDDVPGDLIETGVWRGGATILMRAVLAAYGVTDRTVWVADSFRGLPPPDEEKYPEDAGDRHHTFTDLAISREDVAAAFARYDLLDDQVQFLEGWFSETLPTAPIDQIAVLRLDGDMYGSTMDAFDALYDKVSDGGYVIIDDYGAVEACKKAVHDFREQRGITSPIHEVDWTGVWWRRGT